MGCICLHSGFPDGVFNACYAASSRYPVGFLWIPLARIFPEMCYKYVFFICLFLSASIPVQWARFCIPMSKELLHLFAMCCPWVAYICFVVFLLIAWTCPWSSHRVCHVTLMHPCWVHVFFIRIVYWFHVEVLWVSFSLPLSMLWLSYAFPMCFHMESV